MKARTWLAALMLLASGSAAAAPTVILLSWDGMRHDGPERADAPALARMLHEGARAERLVPVFPPNTFPAHVSLSTGTYPDRHGILDNRFFDRERGRYDRSDDPSWIEAEPLWVAAERQGVTAATYFWVGSGGDWRGIGARYRMTPFDSRVGEARKVEQILRWLDLPAAERPRLIMAWWHGADAAGHAHGPDDERVAEALREQALHLGRLLEGIDARGWRETTLLLVSDHGMTAVAGEIPLRAALEASGIEVRKAGSSALAHLFLADAADRARLEEHLRELDHATVVARESLSPTLRLDHPTRTGDLVVLPDPGYVFRDGPLLQRLRRRFQRLLGRATGMHGFSPDHPDMGGVFLAIGRGVPAGARLGAVRQIDVAPTVAGLLGIEPPRDAEGEPIAGIGDAPPRQSSIGSPMWSR
jgi:predicted AlkP superfamily pyrophosphatase or phosphodiesterase